MSGEINVVSNVPRDPDLVLSLHGELLRVLDPTDGTFHRELGTTHDELISQTPYRFILNARGEETPTQILGAACSFSGRISALKVPSAANERDTVSTFCLTHSLLAKSFQSGR
jgi:hypothetical protein